jgi:oxalate decarboxylase
VLDKRKTAVSSEKQHEVFLGGGTDLVFLAMFKAHDYLDFSLNNWIRHLPPEMVTSHLGLDPATLQSIPAEKNVIIAGS